MQLSGAGFVFERQIRFAAPLRFVADFVIGGELIVEVQGAVFSRGRHTRGAGYSADCEKNAAALARGFRYLQITSGQVSNGAGLVMIKASIARDLRGFLEWREARKAVKRMPRRSKARAVRRD